MKSNYNFIVRTFVLAVMISLLSACAIFKKNAIPAEEIKPESPEKIETSALLNLKGNFDEMNSFQAKTNVEVFFQGNNQEVKSQIRWVRDSVIWMNFSLFGIEGARLLINRDSFFLLDRINKKYMAEVLYTDNSDDIHKVDFNREELNQMLIYKNDEMNETHSILE